MDNSDDIIKISNLPDTQKSKRYARMKLTGSLLNTLLYLMFILAILYTGFSKNLAQYVSTLTSNDYLKLLLFFLALGIAQSIIRFPLKYSIGFKMERRYGLSDQSFRSWIWHSLKGLIVALIIGTPLLLLFYFFLREFGQMWWVPTGLILFVFSVLLGRLAPTLIFPLFYKFVPLDTGELAEKIKTMSESVGMKLTGVYSFNLSKTTKKANAAFAGFGKSKRVLLGDTLLKLMTENEILTVLAHELGHYRLKHVPKLIMTGMITTFFGLYIAAELYSTSLQYFGFSSIVDIGAIPLLSLWLMAYSFLTNPLTNALSREFERQADKYALDISKAPESFKSALTKLASLNLADIEPHPIIEFIFHSHPAISKRLSAIDSYEK